MFVIVCDGSIVFPSRVASLFLYNAFEVILKAVVGLGLFHKKYHLNISL